jgi:hypothetical protein
MLGVTTQEHQAEHAQRVAAADRRLGEVRSEITRVEQELAEVYGGAAGPRALAGGKRSKGPQFEAVTSCA